MAALRRFAQRGFFAAGGLAVFIPVLYELLPSLAVFQRMPAEQLLAIELYLTLAALYCRFAAQARTTAGAALALALAAVSGAAGVWTVAFLGSEAALFLLPTPGIVAPACVTVLLVLAAGVRMTGWPLPGLVCAFLLFGLLGRYLPGGVLVPPVPAASYLTYLVYGSEGLLGRAMDTIVNFVLVYLVFGMAFNAAGGGAAVAGAALRLAGRSRAHAIKACVAASGLFGMASGTATSNVLTSGAFSLPSMRRIGVRNETAAGIEAAASTAGQVMPPVMGATAFILADFVNLPYGSVALAALLPALACYFAFFRQAELVPLAPGGGPAAPAPPQLRLSWLLYLLPPLVIALFLIRSSGFVGLAALAGTACCIAISPVFFGWKSCLKRYAGQAGALLAGALQLIIAAAVIGLLLGMFHSTGIAVAAAIAIGQLGQSSVVLAVLLTAAAAIVMGLGMASVGVYIIVAATLAPGLIDAGIAPLAAHFFVLYCGMLSMITPPVAFASLTASTLAEADFGATARAAVRFGWFLFAMPFIILLQPGLLLLGGWPDVLRSVLVTTVFIIAATAPAPRARLIATAMAAGALIWQGNVQLTLALCALTAAALLLLRRKQA